MTTINFEEWAKLEMGIGMIKRITKGGSIINCKDRDYSIKIKLNAKKNDLIAVGFIGDEIIIPLVNENIPIIPESDIEVGSKVR